MDRGGPGAAFDRQPRAARCQSLAGERARSQSPPAARFSARPSVPPARSFADRRFRRPRRRLRGLLVPCFLHLSSRQRPLAPGRAHSDAIPAVHHERSQSAGHLVPLALPRFRRAVFHHAGCSRPEWKKGLRSRNHERPCIPCLYPPMAVFVIPAFAVALLF